MSERAVELEVLIRRPPEAIFEALTDPASVRTWWRSPDFYQVSEFRLDRYSGGDWALHAMTEEGRPFDVSGRVLEYDYPSTLVLSWNPSWQEIATTTVRITLRPCPEGTLVRLVHSGFRPDTPGYEAHLYGWPHVLRWLATYMEAWT